MIDTIATLSPFLLKALDFVFGEGSKILEERREQQKGQISPLEPESQDKIIIGDVIRSKEDALNQKIVESMWLQSETEIKHLLSLLEIYKGNYYLAEKQLAHWSEGSAPPFVVNNLKEAEEKIEDTMMKLQTILSKVYGKPVIIAK